MKCRTSNDKTLDSLRSNSENQSYIEQREIFESFTVAEVSVYLM